MAIFGPDNELVASTTTGVIPEYEPPPTPKRDLEPAPGQVIVLRREIAKTINGIEKPLEILEREERDNVIAIIARIGLSEKDPWFNVGDEVVIAPHVFTEINLGGDTVWLGPHIGVKARFTEE